MRRVPIRMAKALGTATRWWRGFPIVYIGVCFFLIPLILLGISALFTGKNAGSTAFGVMIVIALVLLLVKFLWWWCRQDGKEKMRICFQKKQNRKEVFDEVPLKWAGLTNDVERLKDYTGLPEEENDDKDDQDHGDKDSEGNFEGKDDPLDEPEGVELGGASTARTSSNTMTDSMVSVEA